MNYTKEDVKLASITPAEFENLCYDLLVKYNFQNLVWRKGGADQGRDIEGYYIANNPLAETKQKWFFECKHYKQGVPPTELQSKIVWADARQPDYLVFFVSSYLSNSTRSWLNDIAQQKSYKIITIEGEDLKNRILAYSDLVERYFTMDGFERMLRDFKDYHLKYRISLSYEFFEVLATNINIKKLDHDDLGLLLFGFYSNYASFAKDISFQDSIVNGILSHLKKTVTNEQLSSFSQHKDNFEKLFGIGIFSDMYFQDVEDLQDDLREYNFQYYKLLLNFGIEGKIAFIPPFISDEEEKQLLKSTEAWGNTGEYLFIIFEDVAFEIFKDATTEIRIIRNYNQEKFKENSFINYEGVNQDYKRYLKLVKGRKNPIDMVKIRH